MSNAGGSTRSRAEPDRGAANAYGGQARSRGGVRVNAKDRPPSSGEVNPDDSASNAGGAGRQPYSGGSYRTNGSTSTVLGKRTERVRETTRENLQVRTRNSVKAKARGGLDGEDVKSQMTSRQGSHAVDGGAPGQTAKKTLRRLPVLPNGNFYCATTSEELMVQLT